MSIFDSLYENVTEYDEWHYAPLPGYIMFKAKDGTVAPKEHYYQKRDEFFELQSSNKLKFVREITYGHPLFHGHSGRVNVYIEVK